jgi:hypothetical protein
MVVTLYQATVRDRSRVHSLNWIAHRRKAVPSAANVSEIKLDAGACKGISLAMRSSSRALWPMLSLVARKCGSVNVRLVGSPIVSALGWRSGHLIPLGLRAFLRFGSFVFVVIAASNLAGAQALGSKGSHSSDSQAAIATRDMAEGSSGAGAHCKLTIVANGATRRQVLARLFAETDVKIKWHNEVFAEEKVYGQFSGTPAQVARRLLERRSYIICYDISGDMPRVLWVDILGPHRSSESRGKATSSDLQLMRVNRVCGNA